MGIKKLNELFKQCKREPKNKYYSTIIYDGSNIIFQVLCSEFSQLKKNGLLIAEWNAVNLNLASQITSLIATSTNTIVELIKPQFEANSVEKIYFVIDPATSPNYKIETNYSYNHKYEYLIGDELSKNIPIELNIKADEQETRKKAQSKDEKREQQSNNINMFSKLSEEQKELLLKVFNQAYMFNDISELMKLSSYVIKSVLSSLKDFEFYIIEAIDEADLVIKNIAYTECDKNEPILVVSADTDYNVLFSDMPNVDTTSLMNRGFVYNPYSCWQQLFVNYKQLFEYKYIIRLAPLFGNDYTVKESILAANNYEDALKLFNGEIETLRNGLGTKKITKIVRDYQYESKSDFTLEDIDDLLFEYSEDYFTKYYLSNIIYENWPKYNKYSTMKQPNENELAQIIENMLYSLYIDSAKLAGNNISTITGSYLDKLSSTLIIWKPKYIFTDWTKFFDKLKIVKFDNPQEFIDYYYENEYDKIHSINIENTDAANFV